MTTVSITFTGPCACSTVTSVLAIGGIGGLAIGLAGREICENLLNGFLIMSTVSACDGFEGACGGLKAHVAVCGALGAVCTHVRQYGLSFSTQLVL